MSETVPVLLASAVTRFAALPALWTGDRWMTFAELGTRARSTCAGFASAGVPEGTPILMALEPSVHSRVIEFAVLGGGYVRVALSPRFTSAEVGAVARDCGTALVLCEEDAVVGLRRELDADGIRVEIGSHVDRSSGGVWGISSTVAANDRAMLLYTSGSTGSAKTAVISQRMWVTQTRRALAELPGVGPGDIVLAAGQLPYLGGSIAFNCACAGAATVTMARFDPRAVADAVDEFSITVLPLATTMLVRMVDYLRESGRSLPTVRSVPYGGSSATPSLVAAAADAFPGAPVQFYGLAEALAPVASLSPADHLVPERRSSSGRWLPGVEHSFDGDELLVRGEVTISEYHGRGGAGLYDGWVRTGDRVVLNDGYLQVLGRTDDMIVSGGLLVDPVEVEAVIATVSGITAVCVVGTPHGLWGAGVTAVVTVARAVENEPEHDLLDRIVARCRQSLAGYKKPVVLYVVDALPLTPAGKPDRRRVRWMFDQERK